MFSISKNDHIIQKYSLFLKRLKNLRDIRKMKSKILKEERKKEKEKRGNRNENEKRKSKVK